jgi:hypothetical protein
MNEKMTVIYVKQTGHIVGAVTSSVSPSVASLVGDGLPVRNSDGVSLVIPQLALEAKSVDLNHAVFSSPAKFCADGGVVATVNADGASISFLTLSEMTVSLPATPAENLDVWIELEQSDSGQGTLPERRIIAGAIDNKGAAKDFAITTVPDGPKASVPSNTKFKVLLLVGGYKPVFSQETTP